MHFEQIVEEPLAVIVLDCPKEVAKERLQGGAESLARVDNDESIRKRQLGTFANQTQEMLEYYDPRRLLIRLNGVSPKDEVHSLVTAAVDEASANSSSITEDIRRFEHHNACEAS